MFPATLTLAESGSHQRIGAAELRPRDNVESVANSRLNPPAPAVRERPCRVGRLGALAGDEVRDRAGDLEHAVEARGRGRVAAWRQRAAVERRGERILAGSGTSIRRPPRRTRRSECASSPSSLLREQRESRLIGAAPGSSGRPNGRLRFLQVIAGARTDRFQALGAPASTSRRKTAGSMTRTRRLNRSATASASVKSRSFVTKMSTSAASSASAIGTSGSCRTRPAAAATSSRRGTRPGV